MALPAAATTKSHTAVVLNPRSASGRTGDRWTDLRPRLESVLGPVSVFFTEAVGHGVDLTRDAVCSGSSRIIAVGGDGTLNEVVNGVMLAGTGYDPVIGLIPQGTGSDFRRTLNVPLDEGRAIETLRSGRVRPVDLMRVTYLSDAGTERIRYAMNVTSFGMGGQVAARVNRSSKRLGGRVAFLTATVVTALGYRGERVRLRLDDLSIPDISITNVAVGNGQYHGAGMHICPVADIGDGLLDITIVERLSLWKLITSIQYLFNGRVAEHPKVRTLRVRRCRAEGIGGSPAIEVDGEPLGSLPLTIEVVPGAVRMILP